MMYLAVSNGLTSEVVAGIAVLISVVSTVGLGVFGVRRARTTSDFAWRVSM